MGNRIVPPPEEWCWQVLREVRWPVGVICPHCGANRVNRHRRQGQARRYRCRACNRIFSDLAGTPFERTKVPLSSWFLAIDLILSKKRPELVEISEAAQVDFQTACRMRDKLLALREDPLIGSIGARLVLWRIKNQGRKECRPRSQNLTVFLLEHKVASGHGVPKPPPSPVQSRPGDKTEDKPAGDA